MMGMINEIVRVLFFLISLENRYMVLIYIVRFLVMWNVLSRFYEVLKSKKLFVY